MCECCSVRLCIPAAWQGDLVAYHQIYEIINEFLGCCDLECQERQSQETYKEVRSEIKEVRKDINHGRLMYYIIRDVFKGAFDFFRDEHNYDRSHRENQGMMKTRRDGSMVSD